MMSWKKVVYSAISTRAQFQVWFPSVNLLNFCSIGGQRKTSSPTRPGWLRNLRGPKVNVSLPLWKKDFHFVLELMCICQKSRASSYILVHNLEVPLLILTDEMLPLRNYHGKVYIVYFVMFLVLSWKLSSLFCETWYLSPKI